MEIGAVEVAPIYWGLKLFSWLASLVHCIPWDARNPVRGPRF